jgi:hypothetical protein
MLIAHDDEKSIIIATNQPTKQLTKDRQVIPKLSNSRRLVALRLGCGVTRRGAALRAASLFFKL